MCCMRYLCKDNNEMAAAYKLCQCLFKARARELHKLGVWVYHNDVCNSSHMLYMMTSYDITHVIHLAAQAGVRYSLINPFSYVTANIDCFLVLLDVLFQFPVGLQLSHLITQTRNNGIDFYITHTHTFILLTSRSTITGCAVAPALY